MVLLSAQLQSTIPQKQFIVIIIEEILKPCLVWHILRSYHSVAEVTFQLTQNCYLHNKMFLQCNIFLWLGCLPPKPPAIYSMKRITIASQDRLALRLNPCQILSLNSSNTNTYIWSKKRVWVLQFLKYETKTFLIL